MTEEIPLTRAFTANDQTASQVTRVVVRRAVRTVAPRFLALVTVVMAALVWLGTSGRWQDRLLSAATTASIFGLVGGAAIYVLVREGNRKSFQSTLVAGEVIRTGFGAEAFCSETSRSTTVTRYGAVKSVALDRGLVFVQVEGQPTPRVFPASVFPREEVERVAGRISGTPPRHRRRWSTSVVLAGLVFTAVGLRVRQEPQFCTDLRRIDSPLAAVREARTSDDFSDVPALMGELAAAYRSIDPPDELVADLPVAVEYFEHLERSARSVQETGSPIEIEPSDDERYSSAMSNITHVAVETCDNRRSATLVP